MIEDKDVCMNQSTMLTPHINLLIHRLMHEQMGAHIMEARNSSKVDNLSESKHLESVHTSLRLPAHVSTYDDM